MATRKVNPIYKATDGTEWNSADEARRRDKVIDAIEVFHKAGDQVKECMLATAVTGDGQYFDPRRTEYFYLYGILSPDGPYVERLYIHPWNMHVDVSRDALLLREYKHPGDRGGIREGYYQDYDIEDLYTTRESAEEAVKKVLQGRLENLQKRISKSP